MKRLISIKTTRNVLVPGWIVAFGCVSLVAPPFGVAVSVALFLVGVLVIPAIAVRPRAGGWRASDARSALLAVLPLRAKSSGIPQLPARVASPVARRGDS